MSLQKAGGTNVDNNNTPAAGTNLVDFLETELVNAGWTIISGAGTDAIKFESAATPKGYKIRVVTSVSGAEMRLELRNAGETAVGATANVRCVTDGTNSWRLMANKYAFVLYEETSKPALNATSGAGKWCICAALYHESSQTSVTEAGFLQGDHRSTTNLTVYQCMRYKTDVWSNGVASGTYLYNGAVVDITNITGGGEEGDWGLSVPQFEGAGSYSGSPTKEVQDTEGDAPLADVLIAWGMPARTDYKKVRGQLFDAYLWVGDAIPEGTVVPFGADNFRCVASDSGSSAFLPFSLFWLQPAA